MGDAAAVSHHDRRRAPPPPQAQALGRSRRPTSELADGELKPQDWLDVFSRIGAGVRRAVLPLSGTEAGRVPLSVGAGGDTTMELDRAAEDVVFEELARLAEKGERFSVLSEEAGLRNFGADYPLLLVDPVDGSLNAKHGLPVFALMIAVLDGPQVRDTFAGLVLNLSTGEEWRTVRKQGVWRAGKPLAQLATQDDHRIELLGLESTPRALAVARPLVERAGKVRILGSMALSIALTAAGGLDAFCAPIPVRVFDMAASLLILGEAGGVATNLQAEPLDGLKCDLQTRSTLLCAPNPELHARALKILGGAR